MNHKNPKTGPAKNLRRRAEDALGKNPPATAKSTPLKVTRLTHELGVHQIELEMQNEELRKAQTEIEAARQNFSDLFDFAPIGYYVLDKEGSIRNVNLTGAALLGAEKAAMIGKRFSNYIERDDQDGYFLFRKKVLETGEGHDAEIRLIKKDSGPFHALLRGTADKAPLTGDIQFRIAATDITRRKTAEDELRRHKDNLEDLVRERTTQVENQNSRLAIEINDRTRAEEELKMKVVELNILNLELTRFNRIAVGRELRMVELKKEINELHKQAGRQPGYKLDFTEGKEENV